MCIARLEYDEMNWSHEDTKSICRSKGGWPRSGTSSSEGLAVQTPIMVHMWSTCALVIFSQTCNDLFSEVQDGGHDIAIEDLDNKRIIAHARIQVHKGTESGHCGWCCTANISLPWTPCGHKTYRLDGTIRTKALEDFWHRALQSKQATCQNAPSKCQVESDEVRQPDSVQPKKSPSPCRGRS